MMLQKSLQPMSSFLSISQHQRLFYRMLRPIIPNLISMKNWILMSCWESRISVKRMLKMNYSLGIKRLKIRNLLYEKDKRTSLEVLMFELLNYCNSVTVMRYMKG
jgi:hypothetical protein